MPSQIKHLLSTLAASLALVACGTEAVQLESIPASQDPNRGESANPQAGHSNLNFIEVWQESVPYEVRLNRRPLGWGDDIKLAGNTWATAAPGEYSVSLVLKGKTVAQTGTIAMRAGSQFVFVISGNKQAPTLRADEIDMSPPSPDFDLRRARITNWAFDKQPLSVIFYDERQNEIWESERVGYGETWSGTIPVDAALWKLTREQKDFAPFVDFFSYRCREPMPLGLVLQHSQPDADLPPIHLGFEEIVQQEPTPCTCPDPALCGG